MDKQLILYCIVVVVGILIFAWQQYHLHKSGLLQQFKAICNDRSLVETLISGRVKQLAIRVIKNIVVVAYLLYCIAVILYQINIWTIDIQIGFSLLCIYMLWQQFTYVTAQYFSSRMREIQ
ncbi:hypothetical protein [Acinetobacter sp. CFCC 10889]|uniref:hypothetical protein n=1 Tax=Acinetobacter sp. CFCC 10889 TaxID=1775557 RepID=UPI000DCF763A|nr:hypothetical protein [Acinetobacter sp. CFCC 10889]